MPHAAAALGAPALTTDADVVWLADVPKYLKIAGARAAGFPDSPRVDPAGRPCKRKEHEKLRPYVDRDERAAADAAAAARGRYVYDDAACAAYRCVDSVNGGFFYAAQDADKSVKGALRGWSEACPSIYEQRANQPALVDAFRRALGPRACAYDAAPASRGVDPAAWRPTNASAPLLMLNQDLFVSGRRAAFAREQLRRGELVAFHANFRFGWRAKCDLLRKLGLRFVETAGDVCGDPAGFECAS